MSESQVKKPAGEYFVDMLTNLIVAIARGVLNIFLKLIFGVFMVAFVLVSVLLVIAVLAGGTSLFAVLLGKLAAVIFFTVAFIGLLILPSREFFTSVKTAVKKVFAVQPIQTAAEAA